MFLLCAYTDFVDVDQEVLFELILAANYMDVKALLDLCCAKVASMMKGKTAEQIRKTFNIVNDFTPEEEAAIIAENKSDTHSTLQRHTPHSTPIRHTLHLSLSTVVLTRDLCLSVVSVSLDGPRSRKQRGLCMWLALCCCCAVWRCEWRSGSVARMNAWIASNVGFCVCPSIFRSIE